MTFAEARRLYGLLTNIQNSLDDATAQGAQVEALWADVGEASPVTLYSAAQKQSFVDIRNWTHTLIVALENRTMSS